MSSKTVILQIPGAEPQGQPRPRVYRTGGRVITHSPHTAYYSRIMTAAVREKMRNGAFPADGYIDISADIYFALPPSLRKKEKVARLRRLYHTQKPDCDNLAKAILDALVAARLIADDRQVAGLSVHKKWSSTHCTYIEIEWNNEEENND
jgi:Holliday junction resolvase RusA-like endonuclease